MMQRLAPRSRCRQRLTRRSWISSRRPVCPQPAHTRRRRRKRTDTTTASALKQTSLTDAPGSPSRLLNAVVTRTSSSSRAADLQTASSLLVEDGGASLNTAQPPRTSRPARPAPPAATSTRSRGYVTPNSRGDPFFVLGGFGPLVAAATMTRILGHSMTDWFKGLFRWRVAPAGTSSQSAYRSS